MSYDYQFVRDHTPEGYVFPSHRLQTCDPSRQPIVLVACGSFSPLTYLHLRLFAMGWDQARNEGFQAVGGYLSPVSSAYEKKGLAPAHHRVKMCELGTETSKRVMVDAWEAESPIYIPTARVLDHFDYEINEVMGGIECTDGTRKRARIVLLAGLDLLQTMSAPGVWDAKDLDHILGTYGIFALERSGIDLNSALAGLKQWEHNIHVIRQFAPNEISSTKVRLLLKNDMSIEYLVPDKVMDYIYEHNLYRGLDAPSDPKEKDRLDSIMGTAGSSMS